MWPAPWRDGWSAPRGWPGVRQQAGQPRRSLTGIGRVIVAVAQEGAFGGGGELDLEGFDTRRCGLCCQRSDAVTGACPVEHGSGLDAFRLQLLGPAERGLQLLSCCPSAGQEGFCFVDLSAQLTQPPFLIGQGTASQFSPGFRQVAELRLEQAALRFEIAGISFKITHTGVIDPLSVTLPRASRA